jgi:hypothetical protein
MAPADGRATSGTWGQLGLWGLGFARTGVAEAKRVGAACRQGGDLKWSVGLAGDRQHSTSNIQRRFAPLAEMGRKARRLRYFAGGVETKGCAGSRARYIRG